MERSTYWKRLQMRFLKLPKQESKKKKEKSDSFGILFISTSWINIFLSVLLSIPFFLVFNIGVSSFCSPIFRFPVNIRQEWPAGWTSRKTLLTLTPLERSFLNYCYCYHCGAWTVQTECNDTFLVLDWGFEVIFRM